MSRVRASHFPDEALLLEYLRAGAYTDCYTTRLPRRITHAQFVEAFYTTWLFRIERWILATLVARRSTDEDVRSLARGDSAEFSAWDVEARAVDQLLLCDFRKSTRSWLMVARSADTASTRLYFGSAVMRAARNRHGQARLGGGFRLLLGFHKLYSRALLTLARRALERRAA